MKIDELTALELSASIKEKKISVSEAVSSYIEKIENNDSQINAFLKVTKDNALQRAKEIQSRIDKGEAISPLAGVPVAVKDNISIKGVENTCASKMLSNYKPAYNATIIEKIENAGMIAVGKVNMDEFALGGSSETGFFGAVHNPWDISRVAGGSSGGSAAAVAAGEAPIALGSDTGGSIRQPCSFCNVTGIKPTYGSVSRYGIVAFASSLDQAGPMGRDIDDCAALLSIISGPDGKDSTCIIDKPFRFDDLDVKGFKIGLPRNYIEGGMAAGLDDDVKIKVLAAAKELEAAGAIIKDFEMPFMDYVIPVYCVIGFAELSSNLAKYDGLKYGYRSPNAKSLSEVYRLSRSEGFGLEAKRRIMLGSFVLSSGYYDAYYSKALKARALIKDAYDKIFKQFDMILSPVAPTTAYKIGENIDDPMKMYMGDIYTVSINLAGLPAIALPCGFDKQGLPVGFELIGDIFSENKLINAGRVFQKRTDFHTKRPGVK